VWAQQGALVGWRMRGGGSGGGGIWGVGGPVGGEGSGDAAAAEKRLGVEAPAHELLEH
jgi:hypothetical protein